MTRGTLCCLHRRSYGWLPAAPFLRSRARTDDPGSYRHLNLERSHNRDHRYRATSAREFILGDREFVGLARLDHEFAPVTLLLQAMSAERASRLVLRDWSKSAVGLNPPCGGAAPSLRSRCSECRLLPHSLNGSLLRQMSDFRPPGMTLSG